MPAILTIQVCRAAFRPVVAELVPRLHGPFILLAPTSDHFDAPCQELLAHARGAFFALEATVLLAENGHLLPVIPPGELFAQFTASSGSLKRVIETTGPVRDFAVTLSDGRRVIGHDRDGITGRHDTLRQPAGGCVK